MSDAQRILDTVVENVTGLKNPYALKDGLDRFAFDIRLPLPVTDFFTGETAWTQQVLPAKYINVEAARNMDDSFWMRPAVKPSNMSELLALWDEVNVITASRQVDSVNIAESDYVHNSENVFRSRDVRRSKNVLWCDGVSDCEYVIASQSSSECINGIRIDDSRLCSDVVSVSWSTKIVKSAFIHDCTDMYESIFCSHLRGMRFCIANMQFEESDYFALKAKIMKWLVNSR